MPKRDYNYYNKPENKEVRDIYMNNQHPFAMESKGRGKKEMSFVQRPVGNFGDHPEEPVGSDCMCVTGHLAGCRYFQSNAAEAVQTLEKPDRQMLSYHTVKDTKLEDSIFSEEEANYMKTPTPERSVEEMVEAEKRTLLEDFAEYAHTRYNGCVNDGEFQYQYNTEVVCMIDDYLTQPNNPK
jgi:hypothetical protein